MCARFRGKVLDNYGVIIMQYTAQLFFGSLVAQVFQTANARSLRRVHRTSGDAAEQKGKDSFDRADRNRGFYVRGHYNTV